MLLWLVFSRNISCLVFSCLLHHLVMHIYSWLAVSSYHHISFLPLRSNQQCYRIRSPSSILSFQLDCSFCIRNFTGGGVGIHHSERQDQSPGYFSYPIYFLLSPHSSPLRLDRGSTITCPIGYVDSHQYVIIRLISTCALVTRLRSISGLIDWDSILVRMVRLVA